MPGCARAAVAKLMDPSALAAVAESRTPTRRFRDEAFDDASATSRSTPSKVWAESESLAAVEALSDVRMLAVVAKNPRCARRSRFARLAGSAISTALGSIARARAGSSRFRLAGSRPRFRIHAEIISVALKQRLQGTPASRSVERISARAEISNRLPAAREETGERSRPRSDDPAAKMVEREAGWPTPRPARRADRAHAGRTPAKQTGGDDSHGSGDRRRMRRGARKRHAWMPKPPRATSRAGRAGGTGDTKKSRPGFGKRDAEGGPSAPRGAGPEDDRRRQGRTGGGGSAAGGGARRGGRARDAAGARQESLNKLIHLAARIESLGSPSGG